MPIEPGDPVVAVSCIGILCKKVCYTIPVDFYDKFFDEEGNLLEKWAGVNLCPKCRVWFSLRVDTPVIAILKGDEDCA